MVLTGRAGPEEFDRILAFYRDNDYRPAINPTDVIIVAEEEGVLCGAVLLREEHDVLVMRGMRVHESLQRQGIGTRLLQAVVPIIGERACFCIPHRYLRSFYGRIGFEEVQAADAPSFLQERCAKYRHEYCLDVIIMRRPVETEG